LGCELKISFHTWTRTILEAQP